MEVELKAIEEAFAERVLAQLHKRELLSDDDVAQILSQDHTGFGVWLGDAFHDKESEQFVTRYIERDPLSLEKLSIQDDIVTYTTQDGAAHEFDALEFLAALSCHVPKTYEQSPDTTVATPVGAEANALSSPSFHRRIRERLSARSP